MEPVNWKICSKRPWYDRTITSGDNIIMTTAQSPHPSLRDTFPQEGKENKDWRDRVWVATAVFRREMAAYFDLPIASIFAIVFLLVTCGMFINDFFLVGVAEMDAYFAPLPMLMILFLPALSMRSWAEEREINTYEFLRTLPVSPWNLILSKYAASYVFFLVTLAGTAPIVFMLYRLGHPDGGKIVASYVGTAGLGAVYLAVSHYLSSLSRDQIVAYLTSVLVLALMYATGNELVAGILDGLWPTLQIGTLLRDIISPVPHFETFALGILDLHGALFFLLMGAVPLWMTHGVLERDR
jgi:ABC-2 type transport system permease protein